MSTEGGSPEGKQQRKRSRLAVASVAAAVLLAGGGGAYWAATASEGDGGKGGGAPGGDGSPPPLALDAPAGGGPTGPSQGIAVGEPDPGGVRYRAEGKLPDGPRTAAVRLSQGEVGRAEVASLAAALHVSGTPQLEGETWRVGGPPGADEPVLQVARKGPGNWSFARYGNPGKGCVHPPGSGPRTDPDAELSPAAPASCPQQEGPASDGQPPVPEEKAKSVAAPVLKALGQDDSKIDASGLFGAVRTVNADPVLDGLPVFGWRTTLAVGSDGQLVRGSGQLQVPPKGATYPLVTADEALKELNKGGGGRPVIGGCATPVPHGDAEANGDGARGFAVPCPPKAPPREPATVTGAALGLSAQSVAGRQALVPSWLFQVRLPGAEKGASITVAQPAVDPEFLVRHSPGPDRSESPGKGTPKSVPVHVESYSVDGKELVLHFWGGVCRNYAVSAEQSAAAVTVKVTGTEKQPGRECILMAKKFDETVTLDEPLGDRKVVDASTGEPVARQQEK
ncbi:hypothetical protein B7P34_14695 [Streptosporangium nondiastaticum]|uniref:Large membrane protein n=1 Tax=Streptosporangium nondiastaticum TaxID=35764 RepID=A0A9X7JQH0_9ACTN|nr:hypothetical protein [Streptosporangium nondiastaticum]PSJ28024.1 hypothetical protein B7P34_14695 [Streptosporangium nondiastaticum]